jgi:hypothetical protein
LRGRLDARAVAKAVEQVPLQRHAGQPIGASTVDEALAVRLENCARTYLRQQRAVSGPNLRLRQARREFHLAGLGPPGYGSALVFRQRKIRHWERLQLSGQAMRSIERQPQRIV